MCTTRNNCKKNSKVLTFIFHNVAKQSLFHVVFTSYNLFFCLECLKHTKTRLWCGSDCEKAWLYRAFKIMFSGVISQKLIFIKYLGENVQSSLTIDLISEILALNFRVDKTPINNQMICLVRILKENRSLICDFIFQVN